MKTPHRNDTHSDSEAAREALAWAVRRGDGESLVGMIDRSTRRRRRRRTAILGAALLLVAAGAFTWRTTPTGPASAPAAASPASIVSRGPGVRVLEDGTRVEFADGAQFRTEFTGAFRKVTLEKGLAFFQVVHDTSRPFVVKADGIDVRAVGTAFAVDVRSIRVDVIVSEGRVAVGNSRLPDRSGASDIMVGARERVSIDRASAQAGSVQELSNESLASELAWRVPLLEFSGTPLADAIPMFNAHSRVRLILSPELGELQMSGVLRADNTGALLRLLHDEFGVEAIQRAGDELLLRR